MWTLTFHDGTLVVRGAPRDAVDGLPSGFRWDDRVGAPRGPAGTYSELVLDLLGRGQDYTDEARSWNRLPLVHVAQRTPRDYQQGAVAAWLAADRRGSVVLPTGSGKTFVAELAIASACRPTLVVAPTLDLVGQWHDRLRAAFGVEPGIIGGGFHELADLTVTTYDSAYLHMARYGDRFGLLVFDEVHHLPAPGYLQVTNQAMAPFRLGLTATLEREDGREELLVDRIGPVVYRRDITDLSGKVLADYETITLTVQLTASERERYDEMRGKFKAFVASRGIRLGAPRGWQHFLRETARSRAGREAFLAYQTSRKIQHGTDQKIDLLATLLMEEHGRRSIIFTNDNATAYRISREFLVPCISHQTDIKERRRILDAFQAGTLPVLVTSKVLNEGVDLPAAEVAIVLSGSGTVREHVQRLGRILRPGHGKQATLYEIVAADTAEVSTSSRRRRHDAYR
jgi:superfamily II DNA or RNA helicase